MMLQTLAKMFGVPLEVADDAMRSERGYRAALSRRSLFAAAGALAVGRVLVEAPPPLARFRDYETLSVYYNGVVLSRLTKVSIQFYPEPIWSLHDVQMNLTVEV